MDTERLVRLAAGGISTLPPFSDKHPETAVPHARQALISAGIIKGAALRGFMKAASAASRCGSVAASQGSAAALRRKRLRERRRSKNAALWFPRSSFPYRGDLKVIALDPSNGMTEGSRATVLDEHYRRMSAQPRRNMGEAAVLGALSGGAFGAAVTGLRVAGGLRSSGLSVKDSLRGAGGAAIAGGVIGAGLGIPFGVGKGYMRNREIAKAQAYTGSTIEQRQQILSAELMRALAPR